MESSWAGLGDQCVLRVSVYPQGKGNSVGFSFTCMLVLPALGCLFRALLTLPELWLAQGCWDEPEPPQHLWLHRFVSLVSAGVLLAVVKQRSISLQDVSMLYWKCWLPQGASLGGGSCAGASCIHTLCFPQLAGGVSRRGDASQSRDSSCAR